MKSYVFGIGSPESRRAVDIIVHPPAEIPITSPYRLCAARSAADPTRANNFVA